MATLGCGTASREFGTSRQASCIHHALVRFSTCPCVKVYSFSMGSSHAAWGSTRWTWLRHGVCFGGKAVSTLKGMCASRRSKALCRSVVTIISLSPRSYMSLTFPCRLQGLVCPVLTPSTVDLSEGFSLTTFGAPRPRSDSIKQCGRPASTAAVSSGVTVSMASMRPVRVALLSQSHWSVLISAGQVDLLAAH